MMADVQNLQTSFHGKQLLAKNLPTLPLALLEAQRIIDDPGTTFAQLAEVIGRDQVITGKVLRMVNSPAYGFPGRIASIQNALVLLGFNVIKSLLLAAALFDSIPQGMPELWRHSSGCASACKELGRLLGLENSDELFAAGLLHDIGKVVIAVQLPEAHEEIIRLKREENIFCHDAEERVLGMAHPRIGAWLAEHWSLPASLRQALAHHHRPTNARHDMTTSSVVHIANFLTYLFEYGNGGNDNVPALDPHAFKHLELNQRKLGTIVDAIGETFEMTRG